MVVAPVHDDAVAHDGDDFEQPLQHVLDDDVRPPGYVVRRSLFQLTVLRQKPRQLQVVLFFS